MKTSFLVLAKPLEPLPALMSLVSANGLKPKFRRFQKTDFI
jgi:hypothetical protein